MLDTSWQLECSIAETERVLWNLILRSLSVMTFDAESVSHRRGNRKRGFDWIICAPEFLTSLVSHHFKPSSASTALRNIQPLRLFPTSPQCVLVYMCMFLFLMRGSYVNHSNQISLKHSVQIVYILNVYACLHRYLYMNISKWRRAQHVGKIASHARDTFYKWSGTDG